MVEYIAPAPAVYAAPALVEEYIAPAPAVYAAPAPVEEYIAPAPAVYAAPARVEEYIAPAPAVYAASAPVDKYITLAPAVFAAPAPSLEYIAPAPAVYAAPAPAVKLSPAPAVIQAPIPAVEFITPVPSVFHAPTPVVESVAQCHAPVFPLSPDASDMSSPEDVYTRSWESLPVPIKSFTQVESAEPLNLASETPTVFHGRDLPAGRRDGLVGHALWLRKEAARRGYAWRQQKRAQLLSSLRAACVPPSGNVGEALRYAPSGAGVLVEALRELATRGTRTTTSGMGFGEGAGARVAVRSVLEDHETAILELERQVELLEKWVRDADTFKTAFLELETRVAEMEKRLRDTEPFVAVVAQLETRVEKMEQLEIQFVKLWGLANLTEVMVAELRKKFESRVANLEQWGDTIAESLNVVQNRVAILEHRW